MAQTVRLCGSFRHWAAMLEWPTPELHRGPVTMTGDEARAAILAHLDRIDRAEGSSSTTRRATRRGFSRARALGRWSGIHPAWQGPPEWL